MSSSLLPLLLLTFLFLSSKCTSTSFFDVADYGAYPDDGQDDADGIQQAIDAAIAAGPNQHVLLQAGTYDLNVSLQVYKAVNLSIIGTSSSTTLLIQHSIAQLWLFSECEGLYISGHSIDYDPLPFTGGIIIAQQTRSSPYTIDLLIALPSHTVDANRSVASIMRYDPIAQRPAYGKQTLEIYEANSAGGSIIIANDTVRFFLTNASPFSIGDSIIVRYGGGGSHAIQGGDSSHIVLRDMIVYTAWFMSHDSNRLHGLTIIDYHVKKRYGRWLSTQADCMHFTDCRDYISITNSSCHGMGDDGLNVHNYYFNVSRVISANTAEISLRSGTTWDDPLNVGIGTTLSFAHSGNPFSPYANYTIAALISHGTHSIIYQFTTAITGVQVTDVVNVYNSPALTISNFTIIHNRARGILLETQNIVIENSFFNATSGPGLLFQPSFYWEEARPAYNVTIRQNVFLDCNEGITQEEGIITLLPDPVQLVPVLNDIRIQENTFINGPMYNGQFIQDYNGGDLFIRDNYINYTTLLAPLAICNSADIVVAHNAFPSLSSTIAPYVFDKSGVCDASRSSGLRFSSDAFNASFDPPVLPAPSGYGVIVMKMKRDADHEHNKPLELNDV